MIRWENIAAILMGVCSSGYKKHGSVDIVPLIKEDRNDYSLKRGLGWTRRPEARTGLRWNNSEQWILPPQQDLPFEILITSQCPHFCFRQILVRFVWLQIGACLRACVRTCSLLPAIEAGQGPRARPKKRVCLGHATCIFVLHASMLHDA